ncbi:hypothetical protein R5R35_013674 [Gryllus longicercus]|uniref:Odorant binding protein n=1 Tax=Gryllus longicercus TaxID=2509291 RepID=A0AAN9VQK5_9ORTH
MNAASAVALAAALAAGLVVAARAASASAPAVGNPAALPPPKGARCQETPTVAEKLEKDIAECQEEIKLSILKEVLESLDAPQNEATVSRRRSKREAISGDDRRIAGCLLQCVYRRVGAVDQRGFPAAEGLVQLYGAGAANAEYRAATTHAVQLCHQRAYQRRAAAAAAAGAEGQGAQTCELAFDIFECVSERIEQYCLGGA